LVAIAGEDRVIYGSDLINLDPRYDFGRVVFSPLPDGVKRKILSGNFLSLLRDSGMGGIAER
jgi:predicted TIM-barrel fold metal-dependent hydrolase